MKKILSMMLLCALVIGALGSFSYISAASTASPYSGGSGTEDDPYLISTEEDIAQLRYAMETDVSLWYTKYYYKLTNDIETSYDLYVPSSCTRYSFETSSLRPANASIRSSDLVPIYIEIKGETPRGGVVWDFEINYDKNEYYDEYFYSFLGESQMWWENERNYYWNAGFTGVFDGNGYTIKMNKSGSFFGFIENEALIMDLNIEGEDASFAYCVDQTSMLMNCNFKGLAVDKGIEHNYGMEIDGITDDGIAYAASYDLGVHIKTLVKHGDDVVIPETINGMTVTGIDERAFSRKKIEINSLYIPSEISWIEPDAFISNLHSAVIGTIYYNGTSNMLKRIYKHEYTLKTELWNWYNVVYDNVPMEGIVLKGVESPIMLEIGEVLRLQYEYYPQNSRELLTYSFEGKSISIQNGQLEGLSAGETTVKVTAESGVSYSFKVKVIGCVGIEVARLPDKVNYSTRQPLDITGIVINKVYNDGTKVETESFTCSGYNALKKGVQTITVTSGEYTAEFEIYSSDALPGDIDLDGTLSGIDSNCMRRIVVGGMTPEEQTDEFFVCDLNGDGAINAIDSALLRRKLAG